MAASGKIPDSAGRARRCWMTLLMVLACSARLGGSVKKPAGDDAGVVLAPLRVQLTVLGGMCRQQGQVIGERRCDGTGDSDESGKKKGRLAPAGTAPVHRQSFNGRSAYS
uniref:DUF834 domain-containing protein n=1 Tax=Oryza brachyantha TaxID=4533 RepID=J3LHA1_ORYBR